MMNERRPCSVLTSLLVWEEEEAPGRTTLLLATLDGECVEIYETTVNDSGTLAED